MLKRQAGELILSQYDREVAVYGDLAATVASLVDKILRARNVQLHTITHRCKSRDSLSEKLSKPGSNYLRIEDITDVSAIRITTYFAEDVDKAAEMIEREFEIDAANSVDKRESLDPDRFGYQSVHYVANLHRDRLRLAEYERFGARKFEIQLRSILQHAWAEIEHDLGYKSVAGVPKDIRRRFSRVAGLLELADIEFCAIRRELAEYAADVPKHILARPDTVGLDQVSIGAILVNDGSSLARLSRSIVQSAFATLEPFNSEYTDRSVEMLNVAGVRTVAELERMAEEKHDVVQAFAARFLTPGEHKTLPRSIGLLYLCYVLISTQRDEDILAFIKAGNFGGAPDQLMGRLRAAAEAIGLEVVRQ